MRRNTYLRRERLYVSYARLARVWQRVRRAWTDVCMLSECEPRLRDTVAEAKPEMQSLGNSIARIGHEIEMLKRADGSDGRRLGLLRKRWYIISEHPPAER